MCRNKYSYGGIFLAILTQILLAIGNYLGNNCCIYYWFHKKEVTWELDTNGHLHFIVFNGLCILASITHIRASFTDPGEIPKDIEIPDFVETAKL